MAAQQQKSIMALWVASVFIHVTIFLFYMYSNYHNYVIVTPMFQERIVPHIVPADKLHYFPGLMHKTFFMTQWNAVSTLYIIITKACKLRNHCFTANILSRHEGVAFLSGTDTQRSGNRSRGLFVTFLKVGKLMLALIS